MLQDNLQKKSSPQRITQNFLGPLSRAQFIDQNGPFKKCLTERDKCCKDTSLILRVKKLSKLVNTVLLA